MPLKVVNDPDTRTVRELRIFCDVEDCTTQTNDLELAAKGGLLEAGWGRRFNSVTRRQEYFCPEHHPKEQASGN